MASTSNQPEEEFPEADNNWDVKRLYTDLTSANEKGLSPNGKRFLRGVLCGHSPAEIAKICGYRGKNPSDTVRQTLYKEVYPCIKVLLGLPAESKIEWGRLPHVLERYRAGYKNQLPAQSEPINHLPEQKETNASEDDLYDLVQRVRSHPHRRDKIQEQCGRIRILDVDWQVGIDNIYIDVNVLEKLPSNRYLELSDFQGFNPATDDFDRLGWGKVREAQVPGLEAVIKYSKLMVLGKPGSGKTTFLKFLAIQCNQGEFQAERIPIFIELKDFARDAKSKGEFSLLNYINQELWCSCDVSKQQVEKLLHQGRALILLDGLDEVQADDGDKVLTQVYDFYRKYFRNQFVITCRIAAQLANQRYSLGFNDVEVADFKSEQIEEFAKKWFVAVANNSKSEGLTKATQFIEKLHRSENQQIRELAVTPILLNLTCWVFKEKAEFPSKRSKLYKQGLDILLKRWDESRGIKRQDDVYGLFFLPQKIKLLSQVAAITFERGDYFFEQDKIQQHIADHLRDLTDDKTDPAQLQLDSEAVLKSIEAQHGLLIERARGIYSFSHLTFQEYFTAKEIVDSWSPQVLQYLVSQIIEERWHEVFLLTAEMLQNADELVRLMKQRIDQFLLSDSKLQQFLAWLNQKSLSVEASYKPASVRAFYYAFSLECAHDLAFALALSSHTPELDLGSAFLFISDSVPNHDFNSEYRLAVALDSELGYAPVRDLVHTNDFEFAFKLRRLLPPTDIKKFMEWCGTDSQAWTEQLKAVMIEHSHISHDWQFSEQQKNALKQYYDANKLLVDCLNSDCYVTRDVREEIEETLLLPIAEIEKQKRSS